MTSLQREDQKLCTKFVERKGCESSLLSGSQCCWVTEKPAILELNKNFNGPVLMPNSGNFYFSSYVPNILCTEMQKKLFFDLEKLPGHLRVNIVIITVAESTEHCGKTPSIESSSSTMFLLWTSRDFI